MVLVSTETPVSENTERILLDQRVEALIQRVTELEKELARLKQVGSFRLGQSVTTSHPGITVKPE